MKKISIDLAKFRADEDGASTVDFVVLTAATFLMALVTVAGIEADLVTYIATWWDGTT